MKFEELKKVFTMLGVNEIGLGGLKDGPGEACKSQDLEHFSMDNRYPMKAF